MKENQSKSNSADADRGAADGERYLWDGTGEVDPLVDRLERTLGPLGHSGEDVDWSAVRSVSWSRVVLRRGVVGLAAAAALALAASAWWPWGGQGLGSDWTVEALAGAPSLGNAKISGTAQLRKDRWLRTDSTSRAKIEHEIGTVTVEPGSLVRLARSDAQEQRLELAFGKIQAFVFSPPRLFVVETPAAIAVDMGCVYELAVDESGDGLLRVTGGWVDLEASGRVVHVPAGAVCRIRAGAGPELPWFEDAPESLGEAARAWGAGADRAEAVAQILGAARKRDSLTLWHLAQVVEGDSRGVVLDHLAGLVPWPEEVSRGSLMEGEAEAWGAWWRRVERTW